MVILQFCKTNIFYLIEAFFSSNWILKKSLKEISQALSNSSHPKTRFTWANLILTVVPFPTSDSIRIWWPSSSEIFLDRGQVQMTAGLGGHYILRNPVQKLGGHHCFSFRFPYPWYRDLEDTGYYVFN